MYAAWIQCGRKPVAGNNFMNDRFFNTPPLYVPIDIFPPEKYFCTPEEAKAVGYEPPIVLQEDNAERADEQPYIP